MPDLPIDLSQLDASKQITVTGLTPGETYTPTAQSPSPANVFANVPIVADSEITGLDAPDISTRFGTVAGTTFGTASVTGGTNVLYTLTNRPGWLWINTNTGELYAGQDVPNDPEVADPESWTYTVRAQNAHGYVEASGNISLSDTMGGVPDQVLWLDGFDSGTFDTTGGIVTWTDKLAGTLEASAPSVSASPAVNTTTGLVTFDGVGNQLDLDPSAIPDTTNTGAGMTVIAVAGLAPGAGLQNSLLVCEGPTKSAFFLNFNFEDLRSGTGSLHLNAPMPSDALAIWAIILRPGLDAVQSAYRNGTLLTEVTLTEGINGQTSTIDARIGRHTAGSNPYDGPIGQIGIWHRPLTISELNAAAAAAGAPYGLTGVPVT